MTRPLYYPTYASYSEQAQGETLAEVGAGIQFYRERLAGAACSRIKECYADALRAYEDELLSREYFTQHTEPDADDPFFEDDVRGYDPGDMIDLTV